MSEIKIQQLKGASFAARGPSGHWVMMDGNEKAGGVDGASRPMEMLLFGLGGCTAVDVEVILKKMKVPVENIEIDITTERADQHPKVYTKIEMVFHFYGKNLNQKKIEKAVSLSKNTYCSASAMLGKTAEITAIIENHNTA